MQAQHATMHMQYANMQYPCATLVCIIQHAQPKDQSSWISPQGDFPPLHAFWGRLWSCKPTWKHNNARDKWENLPRVVRYQGCTHSFGSSQGPCVEANWKRYAYICLLFKIFTVPVVALMVLHGQTQPTQETVWVQYFYHVSDLIHAHCPIWGHK